MARLLAKSVALIAIYAIPLQAVLLGYLHAAQTGFDPVAAICASGGSNKHVRPSSPHGRDCHPCALACNAISAAVVPLESKFSGAPLDHLSRPLSFWVEAIPSPARHQPQASRAPPICA